MRPQSEDFAVSSCRRRCSRLTTASPATDLMVEAEPEPTSPVLRPFPPDGQSRCRCMPRSRSLTACLSEFYNSSGIASKPGTSMCTIKAPGSARCSERVCMPLTCPLITPTPALTGGFVIGGERCQGCRAGLDAACHPPPPGRAVGGGGKARSEAESWGKGCLQRLHTCASGDGSLPQF